VCSTFELDSNRFIAKNGKEYGSFDNSDATYFEQGSVFSIVSCFVPLLGGDRARACLLFV
jgi:hypothetical protein